jgi:hypothetical protein
MRRCDAMRCVTKMEDGERGVSECECVKATSGWVNIERSERLEAQIWDGDGHWDWDWDWDWD